MWYLDSAAFMNSVVIQMNYHQCTADTKQTPEINHITIRNMTSMQYHNQKPHKEAVLLHVGGWVYKVKGNERRPRKQTFSMFVALNDSRSLRGSLWWPVGAAVSLGSLRKRELMRVTCSLTRSNCWVIRPDAENRATSASARLCNLHRNIISHVTKHHIVKMSPSITLSNMSPSIT